MSSRNIKRFAGVLVLSLAAAAAAMAQPQPPTPATGNGSVSGVVTNSATGAPLPHAHVAVFVLGNTSAQSFGTVTDAEGKFTIGGLPPGRLILNADHVGFVAPPAGNRVSDSQLRPDEKKEDVKLTLTPTGAISGRVLNAEGGVVQGAIVSLDGAPPGVNPVTTDEKGQFRISGAAPGRYRVAANPAVMPFPPEIRTDGTREVHYARTYYPDVLTVKAGQRVEVGAGAEAIGIDIRLVRTPVVTLSGRVLDVPAGGKTLVRAVASAATGGGVQMSNNVKADGSFQIWQLDPGRYTLTATNTSQGPGLQRGVQSAPVEVEVSGNDIEHVDLRMIEPFDVTVQLGFDDAKARELPMMQARPVPGQPPPAQGAPRQPMPRRVMLRPEGTIFVNAGQSLFQPIEIGAEDSFTLQKLLPLRYRLMPMWGVYVKSVTVGNIETEGDILDLRNGPAGAVTVTLGSVTGEVSGVVSDSSGPAAGARVVMMSDRSVGGNPMFAVSAGDGTYKFAAVPPGKYKLIAGDNEIVMQFQLGKDPEEYADIAESIEVYAGDKVTKALKKQVSGGK
jgi:hypothetical protein